MPVTGLNLKTPGNIPMGPHIILALNCTPDQCCITLYNIFHSFQGITVTGIQPEDLLIVVIGVILYRGAQPVFVQGLTTQGKQLSYFLFFP